VRGGFLFQARNAHHSLNSPACSCVSIRTAGFEEGGITLDHRNAVTFAVAHRPGFSFVFGGDGKFYTETVIIERPNPELPSRRCPSAVDLGGRDTRVIGGSDRDN
jgi:hypothetical protein